MDNTDYILGARGVTKSFPGVLALENVDFFLKKGEIHALIGENGAGKSTLIKTLTGVEQPDSGQIEFAGKPVNIHSPQHAQDIGIATVYQEVNLCTNISVAENILIGHEPRMRLGSLNWPKMNEQAEKALQRLGIGIDVTKPLGNYPVAIQQMVAITRALEISSSQVLILDEPTSSLDHNETQRLFDVMRQLKYEGMGIIFITHFLDQVYEITDRITVLRNGKLVGTYETTRLPKVKLIANMLGRSILDLDSLAKSKALSAREGPRKTVLKTNKMGKLGKFSPINFEMRESEVIGIAGLLGSGRTELASLIFGLDTPDTGSLEINGKKVDRFSPLESIKNRLALCPEDRKAEGIVGDLSIRENIILALQARYGWFKYIQTQEQYEIADRYIQLLGIATPSPDQLVKNLSGGNQQKVILARWLATDPQVLILDEPTRGIDVGAKTEIQKLVLDLAEQGKSCIFISSELEEVMRCGHRILVLKDQKLAAEFGSDVDDITIMETMAGDE
jgi:galactofuranose transport system ATP-binding protein